MPLVTVPVRPEPTGLSQIAQSATTNSCSTNNVTIAVVLGVTFNITLCSSILLFFCIRKFCGKSRHEKHILPISDHGSSPDTPARNVSSLPSPTQDTLPVTTPPHGQNASSPFSNRFGPFRSAPRIKKDPILGPPKRFSSISKRDLVQALTRPQFSNVTAAPAHLGTTRIIPEESPQTLVNDESPQNYVNPLEVEYSLNPVIFTRLNSLPVTTSASSCESASGPSKNNRQNSDDMCSIKGKKVHFSAQPEAPASSRGDDVAQQWESTPGQDRRSFEDDYEKSSPCKRPRLGGACSIITYPESQRHLPAPRINGIPHRWEATLGQDRQFFEAEREKLRPLAEMHRNKNCSMQFTRAQKGKARQIDGELSAPREHDQETSGKEVNCTGSVLTIPPGGIEDYASSSQEVTRQYRQNLTGGAILGGTHCESNSGKNNMPIDGPVTAMRWSLADPPRPRNVAEPFCQEHKRFSWEISLDDEDLPTNLSPATFLPDAPDDCQDTNGFLGATHSALPHPTPSHKLRQVQSRERVLHPSPISSVETSPTTGSSIFGSSAITVPSISSASSASNESLSGKIAIQSPEPSQETSVVQLITESVLADDPENCPECASSFRTPGLLSAHYNRVHNRRFSCDNCPKTFGLRLDLERHKHTRHKDIFGPLVTFHCAIAGCATPGKKFHRKDNFHRHVERCKQAGSMKGGISHQVV